MSPPTVKVQCAGCGDVVKSPKEEVENKSKVYCTDCLIYTNCNRCGDRLVLNKEKFQSVNQNPMCKDCHEPKSNSNGTSKIGADISIWTKITGVLAIVSLLTFVAALVSSAELAMFTSGFAVVVFGTYYVWRTELVHEFWISGAITAFGIAWILLSTGRGAGVRSSQVFLILGAGYVFVNHLLDRI